MLLSFGDRKLGRSKLIKTNKISITNKLTALQSVDDLYQKIAEKKVDEDTSKSLATRLYRSPFVVNCMGRA